MGTAGAKLGGGPLNSLMPVFVGHHTPAFPSFAVLGSSVPTPHHILQDPLVSGVPEPVIEFIWCSSLTSPQVQICCWLTSSYHILVCEIKGKVLIITRPAFLEKDAGRLYQVSSLLHSLSFVCR